MQHIRGELTPAHYARFGPLRLEPWVPLGASSPRRVVSVGTTRAVALPFHYCLPPCYLVRDSPPPFAILTSPLAILVRDSAVLVALTSS